MFCENSKTPAGKKRKKTSKDGYCDKGEGEGRVRVRVRVGEGEGEA